MASLRLGNAQLARKDDLVTLFLTGDSLKKISSTNLIIECSECNPTVRGSGAEPVGVVMRRYKLRINYALFERKSEIFEFAGRDSVEVTSEQTMQIIWDSASAYIESLPNHDTNTGHRIRVYEVWDFTLSLAYDGCIAACGDVRGSVWQISPGFGQPEIGKTTFPSYPVEVCHAFPTRNIIRFEQRSNSDRCLSMVSSFRRVREPNFMIYSPLTPSFPSDPLFLWLWA